MREQIDIQNSMSSFGLLCASLLAKLSDIGPTTNTVCGGKKMQTWTWSHQTRKLDQHLSMTELFLGHRE